MVAVTGRAFAPFGLRFDALDATAAHAALSRWDRQVPFGYVVTPNVDHLGRLRRQPALRAAYDEAAFSLLDSRVMRGVARLCGAAPPPVVTGADLLAALMPALAARRARIAVIGLEPAAMQAFAARYPGLAMRHLNPARGFEHDPAAFRAVVDFVVAARADCTIFAVGSPRQEALALAVRRRGDAVGIGLCVGAAPLFLAGTMRRAPRPLRAAGLEWAWRLACEPRRLARRYLLDGPPTLLALIRELRRPALPGPRRCAIDEGVASGREQECRGSQSHDGVPVDPRSARRGLPGQS